MNRWRCLEKLQIEYISKIASGEISIGCDFQLGEIKTHNKKRCCIATSFISTYLIKLFQLYQILSSLYIHVIF